MPRAWAGVRAAQQEPRVDLHSFAIALSEMGRVRSGASGVGWWGPGWKLVTWEGRG